VLADGGSISPASTNFQEPAESNKKGCRFFYAFSNAILSRFTNGIAFKNSVQSLIEVLLIRVLVSFATVPKLDWLIAH
ncbi:MAG: hypothetical protein LUP98_07875, partial [Methylococcaceae bacterium]|nr:hypothetical protein [Methylococcaceae bacterium]